MSSTIRGRAAVALLALGAMALGVIGASPASAATTVDPSTPASLTIHKYEQPETSPNLPNNGSQIDPSALTNLKPIEGVTFNIKQVPNVDLSTNAGWQVAEDLSVAQAAAAVAGVVGTTDDTDEFGVLTFSGLPVGLYYVTETAGPAGAKVAAPFLVTLPLTDPTTRGSWLYNVHVYPKNVVTTAGKTVDDSADYKIGDSIAWTITGDIPDGGRTDAYRVTDPLDAKLTYTTTAVTLSNGTPIEVGTHYAVTHDTLTNTVSVDFTSAGLDLLALNNAAQVRVVINTTVNAIGEIENVAAIYPNQASIDTGNPVSTPPVVTKYGNFTAKKVNSVGTALPGAKFRLYTNETDAKNGTNPVTVGGISQWESTSDGTFTVSGLHYSNFANGAEITNPANWTYYYLAEFEAPSGYELLAAPVRFTVIDTDTTIDMEIENTTSNGGFNLPLTGAQGIATLVAAGSLLLAGALLLAVRSRRRAQRG